MSKKAVKIDSSVSNMEVHLRAKQTLIKEQEKYLAFHQQKTKELEEVVEEQGKALAYYKREIERQRLLVVHLGQTVRILLEECYE